MMPHALTIHSHQKKAHGRARGRPICGGMGHRAPTFDGFQFQRTVPPSRKLAGALTRSGPSYRLGWGGSLSELATLRRLTASGVDERAATHIAADQSLASGSYQGIADRDPHTASLPKCSFRPDHHGRSEKGWRYQIQVMRYPK